MKHKNVVHLILLLSLATAFTSRADMTNQWSPFIVGIYKKIYDPSVGESQPWYINDHTFIQDDNGTWHMFGITHSEPANPLDETQFAHATAQSLTQSPWHKEVPALAASSIDGESLLWAPHVLKWQGLYYMFYCAGNSSQDHRQFRIHLATSKDLYNWSRSRANPLIVDGYDARDPYVMRIDDHWVMYYTATHKPQGGNHIVAYRLSDDLLHWYKEKGTDGIAFKHPMKSSAAGPTESPFVIQHGHLYYLFMGPKDYTTTGYATTSVYISHDPFHFDRKNLVGTIPSHALEIVQDNDGQLYVSHAGWGQGGLYLAPFFFKSDSQP